MLLKHYPTLLGGDQCWKVLNAGVFKQIQHQTICWISLLGMKLWGIFDHENKNVVQF